MIEEIILNYLRENAFPCYLSVPENPSGNFCVLEKTGSGCDEAFTPPRWQCSPTAAQTMRPPG